MAVHVDSQLPIYPLTVADVMAMVEAEILGEDDPVELIDGVLVEKMSPQSDAHRNAIIRLNMLAVPVATAHGLVVGPQVPLDVSSELSLPEPDLAILPEASLRGLPGDALLVVEVAVSSRRMDLGRKAAIYAEARIPEYWVLDVERRVLHVHTDPAEGVYTTITVHDEHATVTATRLPLELAVSAVL